MGSRLERGVEARLMVEEALGRMEDFERFIVCLVGIGYTKADIAEVLPLSRNRISEIYHNALRRIDSDWRMFE